MPAHKVGTQHVVEDHDLAAVQAQVLPVPTFLARTSTGEPMPDVVAVIRSSRRGH